jgi:hypothetical protein
MRERVKRFLKRVLLLLLIALGAFALFVAVFWLKCAIVRPPVAPLAAAANAVSSPAGNAADIGSGKRPLEDSYFSYPEWYIVWSYEERAQYLPKNLPSGFPYFASIGQYWRSYCFICGLTQSRRQFNFGDHLSSFVLGGSLALEYAIRGAYEQSVGRLSEWTSSHQLVEEDAYAARVAREYADFVYVRPFYEFHFAHALKELWKQTSFWGAHPVRKWERKFILSVDYGLEAIYAEILEKASHLTYGLESADTYAWIENAPQAVFQEFPRVKKFKDLAPHSYLVTIPRYQEFTDLGMKLAQRDIHFVQIAGNDEIMLTLVAPQSWRLDFPAGEANLLFTEKFLTQPGLLRFALECPVRSLHSVLNHIASRGIKIEHIYDY